MISIEFRRLDIVSIANENKVAKLAKFVEKHPIFLESVAEIISTYTCINSIDTNEDNLKEYMEVIELEEEEEEKYLDEFEKIVRGLYDTQQKDILDKIRGRALEKILEELIKPRYKESRNNPFDRKFERGCVVKVDGKEVITLDRKTVDIACYCKSEDKGEFYEAKVNPDKFSEKEIELLYKLQNALFGQIKELTIGCVSFGQKYKIEKQIEKIIEKEGFEKRKIEVFGKDEIWQLKNNIPVTCVV